MAAFWNMAGNNREVRLRQNFVGMPASFTTCYDPGSGSGMPSGMGCKHEFTKEWGFKDDQGNNWTQGHSFALDSRDLAKVGGSLTCSLADEEHPKEKETDDDCREGYKGTVNGIEVCVEAISGDTVAEDWDRKTDALGNQSDEKTRIECDGNKCKITQDKTITKPDGTTTTTTTVTENVDRQGYCARNPQSAICGRKEDRDGADKGDRDSGGNGGGGDGDGDGDTPSVFGGACAAGFSCEGDAIQCAIAQEQHRRACKLFDDESPESKLYQDDKGKTGNQTGDLPGNETISITGRIDTSDAIGGGGCFGDLSITVWGAAVSLPLSNLCTYLAMLGNILVAVSMLMAARIITRG